MSILITGDRGFIGRGLIGDVGVDLQDDKDILFYYDTARFDVVIHAAALTDVTKSFTNPEEYIKTNVTGTLRMIQQQWKAHFVYLSTAAVYGEGTDHTVKSPTAPSSVYAATKLWGEYIVQTYAKSWTILRLTNVIGEGKRSQPNVYQVFEAEKVIKIFGDGLQTRDFIDVKVVRATITKLMTTPGIFNVGSGVSKSILDVAHEFNKPIEFLPARKGEIRHFGVKDAVHFDP